MGKAGKLKKRRREEQQREFTVEEDDEGEGGRPSAEEVSKEQSIQGRSMIDT